VSFENWQQQFCSFASSCATFNSFTCTICAAAGGVGITATFSVFQELAAAVLLRVTFPTKNMFH
jgi:hypothetical protein